MTPDSMALAKGAGIAATARPSGRNRPAMTISTAQTMNAPTAAENPPSAAPAVAINAPPGVDQAIETGSRVQALSTMAHTPIETESAINPEAASKSLAPTPFNPCSTTAKELAKPTKAVRQPMKKLWAERSLSMAGSGVSQRKTIVIQDQKTGPLARQPGRLRVRGLRPGRP